LTVSDVFKLVFLVNKVFGLVVSNFCNIIGNFQAGEEFDCISTFPNAALPLSCMANDKLGRTAGVTFIFSV